MRTHLWRIIAFSVLVLVVAAMPAKAIFTLVGDTNVGQMGKGWSQQFQLVNDSSFDFIRVDLVPISGQVGFDTPVLQSFTAQGWTASESSVLFAGAIGPQTMEQTFNLLFTGTPPEGVTFRFAAYDNGVWRDAAQAHFNGTDWNIVQLSSNQYDPGLLSPVPEPAPSILLSLGFGLVAGGMLLKKR